MKKLSEFIWAALLIVVVSLIVGACGSSSSDRSLFGATIEDEEAEVEEEQSDSDEDLEDDELEDEDDQEFSDDEIDDFLWKPSSERDGKLVVLINPTDVRVEVSGDVSETLTDFGPSNGRGTTARSDFSGCDFGKNVTVEFYDSLDRQILIADGRTKVTISDGCDRKEFKL